MSQQTVALLFKNMINAFTKIVSVWHFLYFIQMKITMAMYEGHNTTTAEVPRAVTSKYSKYR